MESQGSDEYTHPVRRALKAVSTDDLDFSLSPKKAIGGSGGGGQRPQRNLTAGLLLQALMAEPVSASSKCALAKKPAGTVHKRPAKAVLKRPAGKHCPRLEKEGEEKEEEEEEEDEEEEEKEEEEVDMEAQDEAEEVEEESGGEEEGEEDEEEDEEDEEVQEAEDDEEEEAGEGEGEEEEAEAGEEDGEEEAEAQATEQGEDKRALRITHATGRTYVTEKDTTGKWRLVVEVTERMTENHSQVIDTISKAMMNDMNMSKADAIDMRNDILGKH